MDNLYPVLVSKQMIIDHLPFSDKVNQVELHDAIDQTTLELGGFTDVCTLLEKVNDMTDYDRISLTKSILYIYTSSVSLIMLTLSSARIYGGNVSKIISDTTETATDDDYSRIEQLHLSQRNISFSRVHTILRKYNITINKRFLSRIM